MVLEGKVFVDIFEVLAVQRHPLHHAGHRFAPGQLGILDLEAELIRDHLPSHFPVKWDGVGAQNGDVLPVFPHMAQTFAHQRMDQPPPGIFRIGGTPVMPPMANRSPWMLTSMG